MNQESSCLQAEECQAHYITLKYTGYIQALEHRAFEGSPRAAKEKDIATKFLDAPIRRFLTVVESQLTFKVAL